jgi:predicted adenylyl cyclase CyaB
MNTFSLKNTLLILASFSLSGSLMPAKEIEIKFQLDSLALARVRTLLDTNGSFQKEAQHCETYFDNPAKSYIIENPDGFRDAHEFLRVRHTNKGDSVCYKVSRLDDQGKPLYRDEFETTVGDANTMITVFEKLGFTNKTILQKTRRTYQMGDFEIVIDDVQDLGTFLEVELKCEASDPQAGVAMIKTFLRDQLGLSTIIHFNCAYLHIAWNPDYPFGNLLDLTHNS